MTEPSTLARLVALWQKRLAPRLRRLLLALVFTAVVVGAHVARLGTPATRAAGLGLMLLAVGVVIGRRIRDRRTFARPEGVLRRVLIPTDRVLGERALRAQALCGRAEADESVGSLELARLHLERVLRAVPLEAVERTAGARGRRYGVAALCVFALGVAALAVEPMRVVEGLDVLAARRGVAPLPLPWLDMVRASVLPPAYLRAGEHVIFPALKSALPRGSVVTVRGVPERAGRKLVLTDGKREVGFVDDGSGNVVARWNLAESVTLHVAARFGDVLVLERESLELDAVIDAAPKIELDGAPRELALKDLEKLELNYLASDDHGLRQIDLVMRSGAREERRVLMRLDGQSKVERGAHALDPRDAFLRRMFLPVVATIEARDNDVTASAKWGKSAALTVVPPAVGEPEALRYAALEAARGRLVDLLEHQIASERAKKEQLSAEAKLERQKAERALRDQAVAELRRAIEQPHGGVRVSAGLSAFVLGQVRTLEQPGANARKRTEDALLAFDAGIRGLAQRDAEQVAKRLGDVAEEVAEGAKLALRTEKRDQGIARIEAALGPLDGGARNLVSLGALGADVGSVAQGETRRIRRAHAAKNLLHVEFAARHLAARLRRPAPSFSSAGGGGVESGQGAPGPGAASEADRQFDQLMHELDQLAGEHAEEIRRVERSLTDAEQGSDAEELRREAAERAAALRERLEELPRPGSQPGSARAAAALGREHMSAMAQNLERLALRDAVESGQNASGMLDEAGRLARDPSSPSNWLDEPGLGRARQELGEHLAWAEQTLGRMKEQAAQRAAKDLQDAAGREEGLSRRAGNLAGRGAHSEAKLPDELEDALERAENAMQQAARELSNGRGEEGLELQREAQRLLERSSSGRTSDSDEGQEQPSQSEEDGDGKEMATFGHVPAADKAHRAEEFRKRVIDGLSKQRRGRLGPAVERYAEGLLE